MSKLLLQVEFKNEPIMEAIAEVDKRRYELEQALRNLEKQILSNITAIGGETAAKK